MGVETIPPQLLPFSSPADRYMGPSEEEESDQKKGLREAIPSPSPMAIDASDNEGVCDFCRMPSGNSTVTGTVEGDRYVFCTEACRGEIEEREMVFTNYPGHRRFPPDVAGFDRALPQGIPRNSFVLLAGHAGTREDTLGTELIWRTLERGEPAVLVTFTEPPISVVQRFIDMRWNVLPALEEDRLRIVDCFTGRIEDAERVRRRLNVWNEHLLRLSEPQTEPVRDATDPGEIRNKIDNALEMLGMADRGAVHIDSLTEFGTLVQPVQAYDFIKNVRADVCKGRFVPVFGGATRQNNNYDEFPHDLSYVVDGIIELELNPHIIEDTLLRRFRVRKMNGVLAITEWRTFEFTASQGLVPFDPLEEIERHRDEND